MSSWLGGPYYRSHTVSSWSLGGRCNNSQLLHLLLLLVILLLYRFHAHDHHNQEQQQQVPAAALHLSLLYF
jgi:hypothetical protein